MKKTVKTLALLLSLVLLTGLVPSAYASQKTVRISTADELAALSADCVLDSYSKELTVVIENDIDLTGTGFEPIPLFGGRLEGGGHTISGLEVGGRFGSAGFIRTVLAGAVIKDLNVSGSIAPTDEASSVGGIAAVNQGTISGCSFEGEVSCRVCVGGIAGVNTEEGIIENCASAGSIEGEHSVGGVCGDNRGVIRSCTNRAIINAEITETRTGVEIDPDELLSRLSEFRLTAEELVDITDIGGVAGVCSGVLRDCKNLGSVGHVNIGYNVGGVTGRLSGRMAGCENLGSVNGRKDVGGIVGQIDPYTEWSVSNEKLNTLREKLSALRNSTDLLTEEIGGTGERLSADLNELIYSLNEANSALDILSGDAVSFVNGNVETLNLLAERVTETLRLLSPALDELSGFTEKLPEIFDKLAGAVDSLAEAGDITGEVYGEAAEDIAEIKAEIESITEGLSAVLAELEAFAADPESVDVSVIVSDIAAFTAEAREGLGRIRALAAHIGLLLPELSEAGGPLASAMNALSEALSAACSASDSLDRAERLLAEAVDTLSRYDALTFTPINEDTETRKRFFSSIGDAYGAMMKLSAGVGESGLKAKIEDVSDKLYDLTEFMIDSLEGVRLKPGSLIEDDPGIDWTGNGTISSCKNSGPVSGQTNVGGAAGAVTLDFEFDLEDQFSLSSLLSGSARYVVHSAVTDCENSGVITARGNCAGGIVGRMDFGTVMGSSSSGSISASSCAGGVAGKCAGTVSGCMTRVRVEAESYEGGIAGYSRNINDCFTIPELCGDASFKGAVSGFSEGNAANCFYADCAVGGVDGASYEGCAERIGYEELLRRSGNTELFGSVAVSFVKDGETFAEVTLPYGGSLEELPEVADSDGRHWKWSAGSTDGIITDRIVEGAYFSPVYVLSTGEDLPECLVEGIFDESQRLELGEFSPASGASTVDPDRIISSGTIRVDGCSDSLSVHLRAEKGGVLYTEGSDGRLVKTDYTVDGSYIIFPLTSGRGFIYSKAGTRLLPFIIGGVCAAAALGLVITVIVKMNKRKKLQRS